MRKDLANAPIYVLHFTDNKFVHDVETFGSITSVINYILKLDVTNLPKNDLRKLIVSSMNKYEEFTLQFENLAPRSFFVSQHEMKIETRIHS